MTDVTGSRDLIRDNPSPPAAPAEHAAWPAVCALSFGVFGLVTAELLPVSLLTPMASELGVSNGAVGQAMTATAVIAAGAGPLLVLGSGRVDRRSIVWTLMGMLVVSSVLSAIASSIVTLLLARAVLGFALGGFWAMMGALALRLVSPQMVPRAVSIIMMGVSAATVFAAPLGAFLGEVWGWRTTFLAASGLGVAGLALQLATLPKMPSAAAPALASFKVALSRPAILIGLATIFLVVSGHFAGFTFIRPFLEEVPRFKISTISLVLLTFGIGGFVGNVAAGAIAVRSPAWGVGCASLLAGFAALALIFQGEDPAIAFVATAAWGLAFGGFPVSVSIWVTRAGSDIAESGGALMSSCFQIAIASGAVFGGLLIEGFHPTGVIVYSALAMLAGAAVMLTLGLAAERTDITLGRG